jgi:hypothetical protein
MTTLLSVLDQRQDRYGLQLMREPGVPPNPTIIKPLRPNLLASNT